MYSIFILAKRCSSIALVKIETNVSASSAIVGLSTSHRPCPRALNSDRIVSVLANGASTTARITSALSSLSTPHAPPPRPLSRYSFSSAGIAPSPTSSSVRWLSTPHHPCPRPQPSFSVCRCGRPPASTTTLLSPFATPQRRAARPLSRNNFSSDGTISFVKRISLSPLATPQPHARHSQLMSSASSAGKCSAVSVARKPGMSPLNRSLPARHAASPCPPKISMFFMLAYTPSRNMVVMYSTHGAPRLVPCASRSEA